MTRQARPVLRAHQPPVTANRAPPVPSIAVRFGSPGRFVDNHCRRACAAGHFHNHSGALGGNRWLRPNRSRRAGLLSRAIRMRDEHEPHGATTASGSTAGAARPAITVRARHRHAPARSPVRAHGPAPETVGCLRSRAYAGSSVGTMTILRSSPPRSTVATRWLSMLSASRAAWRSATPCMRWPLISTI